MNIQIILTIGILAVVTLGTIAVVFPKLRLPAFLKPGAPSINPAVGELAEQFASIRAKFESIGATEAVTALDELAPFLFRTKKGEPAKIEVPA